MFFNFGLKIFFVNTAAAKTTDGQLAAVHLIAGAIGDFLTQGVGDVDLVQIGDRVAAFANEVNMIDGVSVEPFHTVDSAYAGNQALLLEQRQIPVNGSQGDVRVFGLKHFVDHVRRRVGCGRSQTFQDGIALFEVLFCNAHGHLPFFLFWGSLVYTHIVAHDFLFVNKNYSHLGNYFLGSDKSRRARFLLASLFEGGGMA